MAGLSETRVWDSLLTTTLANYRGTLMDNIFDVYPLLSWLNGKLGMAMRGNSVKRILDGGERIVEHVLYEQNSTTDSYTGADVIDITLQNGMTIAPWEWKQYAVTVGITGRERRANNGKAAMIRLLQAKVDQSEQSLRDRLSRDAYADGGDSSLNLNGLENIVDTSTTAGGLAPGTFTWWVPTETSGGSFTAQGLDDMRTTFNTVSFGNDKPDVIFTTQAIYEFYEKALQPQERYRNTLAANSGFTNLTFKGVPIFFDRDCTSGVMYMLNSKHMNFVVHRDADFSTGEFVTPNNQDASTAKILFQGNLTTNNRRKLAKITSIVA